MTINSECYTTGKRKKSFISLVYGLTFLSLVTEMRPDSNDVVFDEKTSSANVMVMIRRNHSLTNTYDGMMAVMKILILSIAPFREIWASFFSMHYLFFCIIYGCCTDGVVRFGVVSNVTVIGEVVFLFLRALPKAILTGCSFFVCFISCCTCYSFSIW